MRGDFLLVTSLYTHIIYEHNFLRKGYRNLERDTELIP